MLIDSIRHQKKRLAHPSRSEFASIEESGSREAKDDFSERREATEEKIEMQMESLEEKRSE
jgi:hypothetical protein